MTDVVDLLSMLRSRKQMADVKCYGRVMGIMQHPKSLMTGVSIDNECICVKVEILALNLNSMRNELEEMGIYNGTGIYFVNARMSTFIDKDATINDLYTFNGTLRLATRTASPVLAMFNFYKNGTVWGIHKTTATDIDCTEFDVSSRIYHTLLEWDATGGVNRPKDVMLMPCCYEDEPNLIRTDVSTQSLGEFGEQLEFDIPDFVKQTAPPEEASELRISTEIQPISDLARELSKACSEARKVRRNFTEKLKEHYRYSATNSYIEYMANSIIQNISKRPTTSAKTGQMLIKEYLLARGVNATKNYMGVPMFRYLCSIIKEVFGYMLNGEEATVTGRAKSILTECFTYAEEFYAGVVGKITGVSAEKLIKLADKCRFAGLSFSKILNDNPYYFLVISSLFSFEEIETLALCMGVACKDTIRTDKNLGILYDNMYSADSSTCFLSSTLCKRKLGLTLTKVKHSNISKSGTYLIPMTTESLVAYVNKNLDKHSWGYSGVKWKAIRNGEYFHNELSVSEIIEAQEKGLENGLFVELKINGQTWVSPYRLAEKEVDIYAKIRALYDNELLEDEYEECKLTDEFIDEKIAEYENHKGFKLEAEQRQAVHLLKHKVFCITGCAGSGKTTVADCIIYVFERYKEFCEGIVEDYDAEINLKLCAPTGKASKRMREVLHRPTQTIHSAFIRSNYNPVVEADLMIFDESSMIELSVMHKLLDSIENSRVCFMGDIEQLNPIGKGLPFKNIMRFIPTVKLGVSKRSAENSTITRNANILINNSETHNWKDLEIGSDFSIIPCAESNITRIVTHLCKHNLGTMNEEDKTELDNLLGYDSSAVLLSTDGVEIDDIQVVSPVDKATYSWGCQAINKAVHDIFNSNRRGSYVYKSTKTAVGTEFRIGDRVINTSNKYDVQHYSSYKDGVFQKANAKGVMNGDVGRIVAVYPTQGCEFHEYVRESTDSSEQIDFDKVRDDSQFCGENKFYVIVEYKNNGEESEESYYVLYHAEVYDEFDNPTQRVFRAGTMNMLQLFYAGTTHKLQGSQNKVIIAVLGNVPYSNFITRNMIYTQITRAEQRVYLVGDVNIGEDTAIAKARKLLADSNTRTWGEFT